MVGIAAGSARSASVTGRTVMSASTLLMPVLTVVLSFFAMEILSYVLHRFVFHGVLWRIHQSHHVAKVGRWGRGAWQIEANDAFSVFFAALAIAAFAWPPTWWVGFGISVYGAVYFVVHDAVTHRRFWPLDLQWAWVARVRDAHREHHRDLSRQGVGPYGLFLPVKKDRGAHQRPGSIQ